MHPDAGAPHFAAGLVATSWSEAGRQLARRIEWDVNHSVPVHATWCDIGRHLGLFKQGDVALRKASKSIEHV